MLNDPACKNGKPREKPYKLSDEKGLYLEVMPNGSRYFRMKYRFDGKEKRLALGIYPDVPLASRIVKDEETGKTRKIKGARELRDDAGKLLAGGIDPGAQKKAQKAAREGATANAFEVIAREWLVLHMTGKSERYMQRTRSSLNRDALRRRIYFQIDQLKHLPLQKELW